MDPRPRVPPFTLETARQKVKAAEDAWNTRESERVAAAYMRRRDASINDVPIDESEHRYR